MAKNSKPKVSATKSNQSVEKSFAIIECMSLNNEPIKLQELSKELNMPTSTVLRFLSTLMKLGYVGQDAEFLKYYLTLKICSISERVRESNLLVKVTRNYMKELSQKCNEAVCLAIEKDYKIVYIDVIDGPYNILKTMQRIVSQAPMYCTGSGKLLFTNKTEK